MPKPTNVDPLPVATKTGRGGVGSDAARVLETLRDRIISGELAGQTRMKEAAIAAEFGVSRAPVREALQLLGAEGLVQMKPHAGATVATASPEEAEDLFIVRETVEVRAVRRAAQRMARQQASGTPDDSWWVIRAKLTHIIAQGDDIVSSGRLHELPTANQRFHTLIAELGGSEPLRQIVAVVGARVEMLFNLVNVNRGGGAWEEHKQILAAIDAGDADRAAALMREHLSKSERGLMTFLREAGVLGCEAGAPRIEAS